MSPCRRGDWQSPPHFGLGLRNGIALFVPSVLSVLSRPTLPTDRTWGENSRLFSPNPLTNRRFYASVYHAMEAYTKSFSFTLRWPAGHLTGKCPTPPLLAANCRKMPHFSIERTYLYSFQDKNDFQYVSRETSGESF